MRLIQWSAHEGLDTELIELRDQRLWWVASGSTPGLPIPTLTLLCVYSLGLMGVISPYATGPAPMYYGSGYIGKGAFWKLGLIFGVIYFVGLLVIVLPWLKVV